MSVRLQSLATTRAVSQSFSVRPYLSLLKPRIVGLLVFVSLVAAMLAGGGVVPPDRMVLLILAGSLAAAGASALNQYFERDLDAGMERTRDRPLPAGKVVPRRALILGVGLIALGMVPASALGLASTAFVVLGATFYVVIYTLWLKRSSCWNVPIGGIAGSCAVLTGWYAMAESPFAAAPLLLATILFFWNQSHFWAFAIAKERDYRLVSVPMLPVVVGSRPASRAILVNTIAMVAVSVALYFVAPMDVPYLAGALVAGALFLGQNLRLVAHPTPEIAWSNFKFSGVYLLVLFLAMALDKII